MLFSKRSENLVRSLSFQSREAESIEEGGKKWLPMIGLFIEQSLNLKCRCNCDQILRVAVTTGLYISLEGEIGNLE